MTFKKALFPLICALLWLGCQPDPQISGRYQAHQQADAGSEETRVVTLSLKEGGKGSWSVGDEYVEFRWEPAGDREIWIHTSTGGSLVGTFLKQSPPVIQIIYPGGRLEFQKMES